jgi:hypothetical protein
VRVVGRDTTERSITHVQRASCECGAARERQNAEPACIDLQFTCVLLDVLNGTRKIGYGLGQRTCACAQRMVDDDCNHARGREQAAP